MDGVSRSHEIGIRARRLMRGWFRKMVTAVASLSVSAVALAVANPNMQGRQLWKCSILIALSFLIAQHYRED
jgi:hypothetical protein